MTAKNKINTRRQILVRAYIIFGVAGFFGLSIIYFIISLQNGFDKEFSIEQQKKNTRIKTIQGIRGNIYAADGSLLATYVPTYSLAWDAKADGLIKPLFNQKVDSLALCFAKEFPEKTQGEWKGVFIKNYRKKNRYTILLKDISFDKVKKVKTFPLLWMGKFKSGFWIEEHGKRMYFMGDLAKRAIGYTKNGVSVGLEGAFDSLLRGRSGKIMEQRMPGNIWRPITVGNQQPAENGYDIVTTLDVNFQDITQYALNKALVANEADHGCAVVMDVKTGAIKAIANLKRGTDGKYFEAQNYAVDQFTEPGSTFKLVSVLALLEDGYAKPNDSIFLHHGKVKYFDKTITDGDDHAPTKSHYTLQESFEKSSNVGISQFVWKHYQKDPEKFVDHAMDLGLNVKPKFDIPGANFPLIKTPKSTGWDGTTLPSMSIGYSTKISPLQTLMLYNAIANHGKMMTPYMVQEIRQDGNKIASIEPKVLQERICSDQTLNMLIPMMQGVTARGTGKKIGKECTFSIAGKTGTVRIHEKGIYGDKHMSSFVGFFPAEAPQYTIIVVINEPNPQIAKSIYGADVAGPVFSDIANRIYSSHIKLQPALVTGVSAEAPLVLAGNQNATRTVANDLGLNMSSSDPLAPLTVAQSKGLAIRLEPKSVNSNLVPNFEQMGLRDALQLGKKLGLKITFEGYGRVVNQSVSAGSDLIPQTKIHLKLKPF